MKKITLDELVSLCKRRGIIFLTSEIYGGFGGFFDWGPIGVELRRNIIDSWWKYFVKSREEIYGLYGAIIMHPKVWEASGHVERFIDWLVECKKCHTRYKAEELLEDQGIELTDFSPKNIEKVIKERNLRCPVCRGELSEPRKFNLMLETYVGSVKSEEAIAYMRPETAQGMFINFKLYSVYARNQLPFGIAQVGKVFRNEISPRNFIFRCREFEIAEIEYFINPSEADSCPYFSNVEDILVKIWTKEMQKRGEGAKEVTIGEAYNNGIFSNMWHAYWVGESIKWLNSVGLSLENLRVREHLETELAHYSIQTFDIEYYFPFLGWKEIEGIANRTDYDLKRHLKYSGEKLYMVINGEKIIPHVIEPSWGVERVILALLTEAYTVKDDRVVLKIPYNLAPYKIGVYPLLKREPFIKKAREVYELLKSDFESFLDISGSIGKRYARADEIGVPFGVTIDHQTLEDNTVTIRFRDTWEQVRVSISELKSKINQYLRR